MSAIGEDAGEPGSEDSRIPGREASGSAQRGLVDFVDRHSRLFVLTGAGCSTDSGIPDYRDDQPTSALRATVGNLRVACQP
jgi:hypothetical protein